MSLSVYKLHRSKVKRNQEQKRKRRQEEKEEFLLSAVNQLTSDQNLQIRPLVVHPDSHILYTHSQKQKDSSHNTRVCLCVFHVCVCLTNARQITHTHAPGHRHTLRVEAPSNPLHYTTEKATMSFTLLNIYIYIYILIYQLIGNYFFIQHYTYILVRRNLPVKSLVNRRLPPVASSLCVCLTSDLSHHSPRPQAFSWLFFPLTSCHLSLSLFLCYSALLSRVRDRQTFYQKKKKLIIMKKKLQNSKGFPVSFLQTLQILKLYIFGFLCCCDEGKKKSNKTELCRPERQWTLAR